MTEVAAALAAKQRALGGISRRKLTEAINLFTHHCNTEYTLIAAERSTIERAVDLTQRYRLRGCDSIQLATALIASNRLVAAGLSLLTFVAADADLITAARSEHLPVDNPNLHP